MPVKEDDNQELNASSNGCSHSFSFTISEHICVNSNIYTHWRSGDLDHMQSPPGVFFYRIRLPHISVSNLNDTYKGNVQNQIRSLTTVQNVQNIAVKNIIPHQTIAVRRLTSEAYLQEYEPSKAQECAISLHVARTVHILSYSVVNPSELPR
jgi:hypothetical protein